MNYSTKAKTPNFTKVSLLLEIFLFIILIHLLIIEYYAN